MFSNQNARKQLFYIETAVHMFLFYVLAYIQKNKPLNLNIRTYKLSSNMNFKKKYFKEQFEDDFGAQFGYVFTC